MRHLRRPSGREIGVGSATLDTIKTRETAEAELKRLSALNPATAGWANNRRGAIHLIDLERRARFTRLAF